MLQSTSEDEYSHDARIDKLQKELEEGLRDLGVELGVTVDDFGDARNRQSEERVPAIGSKTGTITPGEAPLTWLAWDEPSSTDEKPHPTERHTHSLSNETDEEEGATAPRQQPSKDTTSPQTLGAVPWQGPHLMSHATGTQRRRPASALSMHTSARKPQKQRPASAMFMMFNPSAGTRRRTSTKRRRKARRNSPTLQELQLVPGGVKQQLQSAPWPQPRPTSGHAQLRSPSWLGLRPSDVTGDGGTRRSWVVGDTMGIPFPSIPSPTRGSQFEPAEREGTRRRLEPAGPQGGGFRCRGRPLSAHAHRIQVPNSLSGGMRKAKMPIDSNPIAATDVQMLLG